MSAICRFDTDDDGNCHIHPKGCPDPLAEYEALEKLAKAAVPGPDYVQGGANAFVAALLGAWPALHARLKEQDAEIRRLRSLVPTVVRHEVRPVPRLEGDDGD